ncbi:TBC domain protein [Ancylostoma caninum]|uniref:TBC domain protein n=1 Tax=Ancylostoma caninum TaxID=29170 RepID=A0A368H822_ANCCA|nr:TBC domain protein [Ancylostoma caninum]
MLPYVAYKYVKNKREATRREMETTLDSLTSHLSRSMIPDQVVLRISGVSAKFAEDSEEYVSGTLTIVEKAVGVFIEWFPCEDHNARYAPDTSGWVLAEDGGETQTLHSPSGSPDRTSGDHMNKLAFSIDVNDLSSFRNVEPKKGQGYPCIRLICKDGTSYVPLYFTTESTVNFIDVLQRYITLRRSAREPNLVLVVDGKAEALAQSVIALGQNDDVLSRFMKNPYAAALTGFGKITSFMQEQMIPALLDSDEVSQEEQIRAMRELSQREDDAAKLRINTDATSEFELVTQLELPPRPDIYRESPVTQEIWDKFKMPDGTVDPQNIHHLKMNVFRGGLNPDLRKEAWKYLLGYRAWDETNAQFEKKRSKLAKEYERLKAQWISITEDQESRFFSYSKRKGLVEKDVARTDRSMPFFSGDENPNLAMLQNILMTYVMYNFDLGYVQGMSDFASPLIYVMGNEVDAFWCFVELMKKIQRNFEKDQAAIKLQMYQLRDLVMIVNPQLANYLGKFFFSLGFLEGHQSDDMYFCFRWVLVWFKRELSFADTCKLWEVLWTGQPCPNFLLLVCVAILDSQMNTIIDNKFGLTEILKHVNDLSMHLVLDDVMTAAEAIFHQLSASQDKLPAHICEYLNLGEAAS